MMTVQSSSTVSNAIIFVDAAVADHDQLASGVVPGTEVVILDPNRDGVEQITATLQGRSLLSSLQIISHGEKNSVQLGRTTLSLDTLDRYSAQLQQWRSALTETADILLYGCNITASTASSSANDGSLVRRLSWLTGADVAASTNLTGAGGDWILESTTGAIETRSALRSDAIANYQGTLNTITVTSAANSGAGSLRAAIAAAAPGSTIRFASSLINRTITLTSGQLDITKPLTLDGGGVPGLTISGNNTSRVFNIARSVAATIRNLTIANGRTTGSGGGINVVDYGSLTLVNSRINNNVAGIGGGVRIGYKGRATVTNSSFDRNNGTLTGSGFSGGAIATFGSGTLTVTGSRFTNNRGINGGGIYSLLGGLTVENSVFLNNSSGGNIGGGAIFTDGANPVGPGATVGGTITVRGSRFEGNQTQGEGGALFLFGYGPDKIFLENSTVIGNSATVDAKGIARGGGIRANSALTIRNVTVANNTAAKQGGGLWLDGRSSSSIINSTFSGNRATSDAGGAMFLNTPGTAPIRIVNSTVVNNAAGRASGAIWLNSSVQPVTLVNSIVANNTASDPSQRQVGFQLRDGGGNIEFPGPTSGRRVVSGSRIIDPRLSSLRTINSVLAHAPLSGSPAINTGIRTGAPTTDQRGFRRDSQIDVGAIEVGATPITTSTTSRALSMSSLASISGKAVSSQRHQSRRDMLTGVSHRDPLISNKTMDRLLEGGMGDRIPHARTRQQSIVSHSLGHSNLLADTNTSWQTRTSVAAGDRQSWLPTWDLMTPPLGLQVPALII